VDEQNKPEHVAENFYAFHWASGSKDPKHSKSKVKINLSENRVFRRIFGTRKTEMSKRSLKFFSSPPRPDRLWGPPSLLFKGYRGFFPQGVKRPGRVVDHSPPSSAEVKNTWSYTYAPYTPSRRGA
jgi:hypothetical protein